MNDKRITISEAFEMDRKSFSEACEIWFGNRAINSVYGNYEDAEISNHNAQLLGIVLRERLK